MRAWLNYSDPEYEAPESMQSQPVEGSLGGTSEFHAGVMLLFSLIYLGTVGVIAQWWSTSSILDVDTRLTVRIMLAVWLPFVVEALWGMFLNPSLKGNWQRLLLVMQSHFLKLMSNR